MLGRKTPARARVAGPAGVVAEAGEAAGVAPETALEGAMAAAAPESRLEGGAGGEEVPEVELEGNTGGGVVDAAGSTAEDAVRAGGTRRHEDSSSGEGGATGGTCAKGKHNSSK